MHGALELWRRAAELETWRYEYGVLELWKCAAGVATWRSRGLEARYRSGETEEWRHRGLEARWRCSDVEAVGLEVWGVP